MKIASFSISVLLFVFLSLISCQPDDRNQISGPARDPQTQADLDNQKLRALLNNYTFNDVEFEISDVVDNVRDNGYTHQNIKFIRIKDDEGNEIPLSEEDREVSSGTPLINNTRFLDSVTDIQVGDIRHTAYFLKIREGQGKPVTIVDPVLITYRGDLFGNTDVTFEANEVVIRDSFDNINTPLWNGANTLAFTQGFREVASRFKTAIPVFKEELSEVEDSNQLLLKQCQVFESDTDGFSQSVIDNSYAIGVAFVPSGLAFDGIEQAANGLTIQPFQNLIYSFTLFNTEYVDFDNDGIPSLLEMISEDGSIDPTIDTDNDGNPNYDDEDDDGDERATSFEIEVNDADDNIDSNCDGVLTNDNDVQFKDENENGVFDHLDSTIRVGL